MWHLPSLLRIANLVQYQSLLLRKIVQMWYLLHICCNLATLVNPFFRPVFVSTISLHLDFYTVFLQITFLITMANSVVFVFDSIVTVDRFLFLYLM